MGITLLMVMSPWGLLRHQVIPSHDDTLPKVDFRRIEWVAADVLAPGLDGRQ